MRLQSQSIAIIGYLFRFWLSFRYLLPKRECRAFARRKDGTTIEKIFVINLDRDSGRWANMKKELSSILDATGIELLNLTERHTAVDGNEFLENPFKDNEIDPFYTLGDQLFVEPQPLVVPTHFELTMPIQMSRAEVAVAKSHIKLWKNVAAGNHEYVLILEDDIWFRPGFAKKFDSIWTEVNGSSDTKSTFDVLYLSYLEVKHGAPKSFVSKNVFRPVRGLWQLSGYILSRSGAQKLLRLLPCRGPVDLWINHQFQVLNILAAKSSLIKQRADVGSTNSYSILPALTRIGAINSEGGSLYRIRPVEEPVFAFGPIDSGQSSLAIALSMLGYRCCSDFTSLPAGEMERLLDGRRDCIFNAYVNIGSLNEKVKQLRSCFPKAKFIITTASNTAADHLAFIIKAELEGADIAVLRLDEINKWRVVCEHLRCAPPPCCFPLIKDLGQRSILEDFISTKQLPNCKIPKRDNSPWVIESRTWWNGINVNPANNSADKENVIQITDLLSKHNAEHWLLRNDTFTDNLTLFRPSNIEFRPGLGAVFSIKKESLGVRNYSGASLSSVDSYLFGKFEATLQPSNAPGVITGLFLHRNSPRQEIDIEITGNRPDRLVVNVFYNPGDVGAKFDYGYRGSPTYIELGFDASKAPHRFAIEWSPCEILWFVDGKLIHRRAIWDPTPIPNMPMTFHLNSWLTRSKSLAGRINNLRLPATSIVSSIDIKAGAVITSSKVAVKGQHSFEDLHSTQIIQ